MITCRKEVESSDVPLCLVEGYERYNAMRADPDLCFLERVGMPDVTALSAELGVRAEVVAEMTDRWNHCVILESRLLGHTVTVCYSVLPFPLITLHHQLCFHHHRLELLHKTQVWQVKLLMETAKLGKTSQIIVSHL